MQDPVALCVDKNHPPLRADWTCVGCHKAFCSQCVQTRMVQTAHIESCRECNERCIRIRKLEEVSLVGQGSLSEQIPQIIRYPLKGPGAAMMVSGGIAFFFMETIALHTIGILGIILSLFITGYICAYMLKITAATANGKMDPPQWPDVAGGLSLFEPIFQTFTTFLLCLAPSLLYFYYAFPPNWTLYWILFCLGFFFWPMMWILVSVYGTVGNLNPILIVSSILKILKDYLIAYSILLLCVFIRFFLVPFLNRYIPYVGGIFGNIVALYFLMLEMHLVGLLYLCNKKKLDWSVSSS